MTYDSVEDLRVRRSGGDVKVNLTAGRLTRIPEALRDVRDLTELQIFDNQLTEVPPWIGEFRNLRTLVINANRLHDLPDELSELIELRELYLEPQQIFSWQNP